MKKLFLGFLILPLIVSNVFASTAKSKTETEVFGTNNVVVSSSAETIVNGKRVKVESNQPGSIELEMKDDQVKIKTSKNITPTVFISPETNLFISNDEIKPVSQLGKNQIVQLPGKMIAFFKNFLNRIFRIFTP